jgi:hypothetical protein
MKNLTSYEKLLLNTQVIQFVFVNFSKMITEFQDLEEKGSDVEPRLTEMIDLFNEVNRDVEEILANLLETLNGWDALSEFDLAIINQTIDATLNKS